MNNRSVLLLIIVSYFEMTKNYFFVVNNDKSYCRTLTDFQDELGIIQDDKLFEDIESRLTKKGVRTKKIDLKPISFLEGRQGRTKPIDVMAGTREVFASLKQKYPEIMKDYADCVARRDFLSRKYINEKKGDDKDAELQDTVYNYFLSEKGGDEPVDDQPKTHAKFSTFKELMKPSVCKISTATKEFCRDRTLGFFTAKENILRQGIVTSETVEQKFESRGDKKIITKKYTNVQGKEKECEFVSALMNANLTHVGSEYFPEEKIDSEALIDVFGVLSEADEFYAGEKCTTMKVRANQTYTKDQYLGLAENEAPSSISATKRIHKLMEHIVSISENIDKIEVGEFGKCYTLWSGEKMMLVIGRTGKMEVLDDEYKKTLYNYFNLMTNFIVDKKIEGMQKSLTPEQKEERQSFTHIISEWFRVGIQLHEDYKDWVREKREREMEKEEGVPKEKFENKEQFMARVHRNRSVLGSAIEQKQKNVKNNFFGDFV